VGEDIKEQARERVDQRGGLDVGEAIEPVEKALNGLTERTDKRGESVAGSQNIVLSLDCIISQEHIFTLFTVRKNLSFM